jgi:hypothetical protein
MENKMVKLNEDLPTIDSLKPKLIAILSDPKNYLAVDRIGEIWTDDHEICCAVKITTIKGIKKVALWWCGFEIAAAAEYSYESLKAYHKIVEYIADIAKTEGDA